MDNRIENFIKDLESFFPEKVEIVNEVRKMFKAVDGKLEEKFIYGGIGVYFGEKLIGGVWVYSKHVSVIFSDGYKLKDPDKILEGNGKFRRHIKVYSKDDLEKKKVKSFIEQCVDLEN